MSFVKDQTGSAQTAANASAVVVAAFADQFKSFDDAVEAYNTLRTQLQEELFIIVDSDNEKFAANDSGSNGRASKRSNGKASGASARKSKTGGRSGGSGKGKVTLEDALEMVLSFGAFEGESLETVLGIDADTADSEYDYGDGERDGTDYIAWLAGDRNKNEFVQRRAQLIADAEGIEYSA